jgi:two-component system alkaline phosphatase synthesis response regulator PhoP
VTETKPIIVLVEDDTVLSQMYLRKFELEGFDAHHALDGQAGLDLVRKVKPDIVLMDIMMPKKNGLDALKELRDDPEIGQTFVALLTNVGEQQYMDEGTRLGANEYLMKSALTPREVVEKIHEWMKTLKK